MAHIGCGMRYLWLVLLVGCGDSGPDRERELAACELISKSGDALASCLIFKYSWDANTAGPAKMRFQWTLDSIRGEHEQQVAAILAQQQARQDSLDAVQFRRAAALAKRQEHLDSIDARFQACDLVWTLDWIDHMNQARRDSGRAICLKARATVLRQAGFSPNALPDPES